MCSCWPKPHRGVIRDQGQAIRSSTESCWWRDTVYLANRWSIHQAPVQKAYEQALCRCIYAIISRGWQVIPSYSCSETPNGVWLFYLRDHNVNTNHRPQETPEPSSSKELQDLQEENAMLIDKLEQAKKHSAEQADEIQLLKSIIREAQVTIDLHQQDLQQWISVAKYYQQSCFQCSDVLGQAITFLQGLKSEIPASTPVQD